MNRIATGFLMSISKKPVRFAAGLSMVLSSASFGIGLDSWSEGDASSPGASKVYYNAAAKLRWKHAMGDWLDARQAEQGSVAFAESRSAGKSVVTLDLTRMVNQWLRQPESNHGVLLRALGGSAIVDLHSREAKDESLRPRLEVEAGGRRLVVPAIADTQIDKSTTRSLGTMPTMKIDGGSSHALIAFDHGPLAGLKRVDNAVLRLAVRKTYGGRPVRLGAFQPVPGGKPSPELPLPGLAANYVNDEGIDAHSGVYYFSDFSGSAWKRELKDLPEKVVTVSVDEANRFEPLSGEALRVTIPKGRTMGLNASYFFKDRKGGEPEELYFRYYLRIGQSWDTVDGGKFPGIAGTYNKAGWGGRRATGKNGWSARGLFAKTAGGSRDDGRYVPTGSYVYHVDAKGGYGEHMYWERDRRGVLERNRWYCIEHYVKLNTPGEHDGILRGWIDGRPAFERTNIRFRDDPALKIERVWLNVYHGGTTPVSQDSTVFIDNVVVAKEYIGPMVRADAQGNRDMGWWFEAR